jgi:hypothetical protein
VQAGYLPVAIVQGPHAPASLSTSLVYCAIDPHFLAAMSILTCRDWLGTRSQVGVPHDASLFSSVLLGRYIATSALALCLWLLLLLVVDGGGDCARWTRGCVRRAWRAAQRLGGGGLVDEPNNGRADDEDADVALERARVQSASPSAKGASGVWVSHLRKEYSMP